MKTPLQFLAVFFTAATIICSCSPNSSDKRAEAMKTNRYDPQPMADSVSSGATANSPYNPSSDQQNKQNEANQNTGLVTNALTGGNYTVTTQDANGCTASGGSAPYTYQWNTSPTDNLKTIISSSAARATRLDSTHRFIRTADVKFRVKNVADATYRLEDITARFKGYVADTRLTSDMQSLTQTPVSKDSSLETMKYVVTNTLTLRIPSENLDTTMKSLVPLIDYLDYRNINMHDITLEVLSNNLAQNRLGKYNARMANDIDTKGKHLDDVQNAEQSILNSQESSDNALIENLRQDDQVRYATITILIYQRETIRQELILREKTVDAYEPGLGSKLCDSLSTGWHGLQTVIMIFVLLWPLWLIAFTVAVCIKWALKGTKKITPKD
jgi:hypothetical protein